MRTSLRNRSLAVMMLGFVVSAGCGVVDPDAKPNVPADHTDARGGVLHRPGAEDPHLERGNCSDYKCHHANLEGGWALQELEGGGRLETSSPSCYQCHGVNWNVRQPGVIRIDYPDPNAVWEHGASRFVEWWAVPGRLYEVQLVREDTLVAPVFRLGESDGVVRIESILASWGVGAGFRVRVRDNTGQSSVSPSFSICAPGRGVVVTRPEDGAEFEVGETLEVEWYCAAGISVDVLLYREGEFLEVIREGSGNSGFESREIPERWGSGEGFTVRIRDREGRTGSSGEFRIR